MKYYIISGEASGDLHGSKLIAALKKIDQNSEFRAWGGDLMEKEGAFIIKHYKNLAFMGVLEVILRIPKILKNIAFCKSDILKFNPDVIIYIDFPGFNLRIAKWAKQIGFKNHYYISPSVWAWRESRVKQIKKNIESLYVVLPFEKEFFEKKHKLLVNYVGHPLLDHFSLFKKNKNFFKIHSLNTKKPIVALLPGSRLQEIKKNLPLFIKLESHFKEYQFIIACAPNINLKLYLSYIKNSSIKLLSNHTYDLLYYSSAAIVTSGTATLETALFNTPQLVCYKTDKITYWLGKKFIKIKYISLVNLILNKPAVVELIQDDFNLNNLISCLNKLLKKNELKKINKNYKLLKSKLGGKGASKKTAQLIFASLK